MLDPRLTEAFFRQFGFRLEDHLVVLARIGSHSHGTYMPPTEPGAIDDVDFMGFVVPPLEYHLGLQHWEGWSFQFEELDVVLYSLEKAFRLLLKANPNIVGTLWLRPEDYVFSTDTFDQLREHRDLFHTRLAGESFAGYAHEQLRKMTSFDPDKQREYDLLRAKVDAALVEGISVPDILHADNPRLKHISQTIGLGQDFLQRFRQFHKNYFAAYMGEKRKALIRKHGYDSKNSSHLIRLLRMGVEYLQTETLTVFRPDAEELKAIKRGEWTLERIKAEADRLFLQLAEARVSTKLPEEPDTVSANRLLIDLHRQILYL